MKIKIENFPDLVRDAGTRAIVALPGALEAYRIRRSSVLKERDRDNKVAMLENEIKDLKSIVRELLNRE